MTTFYIAVRVAPGTIKPVRVIASDAGAACDIAERALQHWTNDYVAVVSIRRVH